MPHAPANLPVEPPVEAPRPDQVPLCVDLDGTLVSTDLLFESLVALARTNVWALLLVPFWLAKGVTRLKSELARRTRLDPALLPYRQDVIDWLVRERADGRRLLLVTGSHERLAHAVADQVQLFDEVLATTDEVNLVRAAKRDALTSHLGVGRFDYAGDARADLPVWSAARQAVVVAAAASVEEEARRHGNVVRSFPPPAGRLTTFLRAIRVHQWAKNVLLFVPLLTAHRFDVPTALKTAIGALAFSLCASAVYLANDLLDLDSDRRHRTKKARPLAAGALPLWQALVASPLLLLAGAALALALSFDFALVLALYLVVTTLYTFLLKRFAVVDVVCLAALYSLRIFAGGQLVDVPVSDWLIAFSMFFFLSLALVKRVAELLVSKDGGEGTLPGRGYSVADLPVVMQLGVGAGHLSVLVFAVYIQSDTVRELYRHPWALWFVCPLIFLWLGRVWLLVGRGLMHDDPVVFAVRDRASYAVALIGAATLWLAH